MSCKEVFNKSRPGIEEGRLKIEDSVTENAAANADFLVDRHASVSETPPFRHRRGDRVADCAALEMLCTGNGTEGSNPSLSAIGVQPA